MLKYLQQLCDKDNDNLKIRVVNDDDRKIIDTSELKWDHEIMLIIKELFPSKRG